MAAAIHRQGSSAEPKLLLLDEITANLDAETEKAVLAALKRVAKDRTVISIHTERPQNWEGRFRFNLRL